MSNDAKPTEAVVVCEAVTRTFVQGQSEIRVLHEVNLTIDRGERIAIVGASGAGKSTLLHLLGGLDRPNAGRVLIEGIDLATQTEKMLAALRNRAMGFVYQFHHLLPEFSALENVAMPLLIGGLDPASATEKASAMLERVGLAHRVGHKPGELSGGERQRTAVARAMVHRPSCLLADEPTGNLDEVNSEHIYDLMLELNTDFATALVVVTHDRALAHKMDRCLEMVGGQLHELT
ncbi:MAG TPA: lipoprotein-releasing ABC transporter ATP-binding protein LolD [Wenzhouxiangella sp.]